MFLIRFTLKVGDGEGREAGWAELTATLSPPSSERRRKCSSSRLSSFTLDGRGGAPDDDAGRGTVAACGWWLDDDDDDDDEAPFRNRSSRFFASLDSGNGWNSKSHREHVLYPLQMCLINLQV